MNRLFPIRFVLLALICWFTISLNAQIGLSGSYLSGTAEDWQYQALDSDESIDLPGTGWQASIDYWLRLKNFRVEFLPTLAYSIQQSNFERNTAPIEAEFSGFHFFLNTNFYILDFEGDCDCPTFSKQGPGLNKGLFLQLSPGWSFFNQELRDDLFDVNATSEDSAFSVGLGLGLDLGVSDLITVTPQVGLRYYPSVEWIMLDEAGPLVLPPSLETTSNLTQFTAGLRLGLRLDR